MAAGDVYSAARLVDGSIVLGCVNPLPPSTCCYYPAEFFGTLFAQVDLPDAILINGLIASRSGDEFILDTDPTWIVRRVGSYWFLEIDGVAFGANTCLFGEFDPSYQMDFTWPTSLSASWADGAATLIYTPDEICIWLGEDASGNEVYIFYDLTDCKFYCVVQVDLSGFEIGVKTGNQDTPIGTYMVSGDVGTVTISA